ncbi:hypothetical protein IF2G_10074 [Cordyceps javanica]|nr:hypothetical protein IF2G_10074 [Cordyceps javanica]
MDRMGRSREDCESERTYLHGRSREPRIGICSSRGGRQRSRALEVDGLAASYGREDGAAHACQLSGKSAKAVVCRRR